MPEKQVKFEAVKKNNLETRKFIVRHMDMEKGNEDFPIRVDTLNPATGGMKRFAPGSTVELTRTQVEILKNAVIESSFTIGDVGDYASVALDSDNPMAEVQKMYPEFQVNKDRNGVITATKRTPRFAVEPVNEEKDGWAA